MKRFYRAGSRVEAYLVLHHLEHAGIRAHVFNAHVASIVGEVPPDVAQPEVWLVDDADEPRAARVVAAMGRDGKAAGERLTCRQCGEENPGNFEICWHCGRSL